MILSVVILSHSRLLSVNTLSKTVCLCRADIHKVKLNYTLGLMTYDLISFPTHLII